MKNLVVDEEGEDLGGFINTHYKRLSKNCRALYLIKPKQANGVVKVGIAGNKNGGRAYPRLKNYVLMYGNIKRTDSCLGVHIYACYVTNYNPNTEPKKSRVYKMESKLKQRFAHLTLKDRGDERFMVDIKKILNAYKILAGDRTLEDEVTPVYERTRGFKEKRKEERRLKQKELMKEFEISYAGIPNKGERVVVNYKMTNGKIEAFGGKVTNHSKNDYSVKFDIDKKVVKFRKGTQWTYESDMNLNYKKTAPPKLRRSTRNK